MAPVGLAFVLGSGITEMASRWQLCPRRGLPQAHTARTKPCGVRTEKRKKDKCKNGDPEPFGSGEAETELPGPSPRSARFRALVRTESGSRSHLLSHGIAWSLPAASESGPGRAVGAGSGEGRVLSLRVPGEGPQNTVIEINYLRNIF